MNIDPFRVDEAQRRRIASACGGTAGFEELASQPDLERVDGTRTTVLVTEDLPRDLSRWPALRFVQLISAGINHLDGHPIWKTDIEVATAAGTHAVPIGQHASCVLLMLVHHMPETTAFKSTRTWPNRVAMASTMLRGKTAGMLGYGGIGRECARQLHALGMRIVCLKSNPTQRRHDGFTAFDGVGDPDGVLPERWFGPNALKEMLPICDAL
ncbi:MAG: NAD(P)-dependent oxidoreductase, partial [Tepidisphaeraceae bacterium]